MARTYGEIVQASFNEVFAQTLYRRAAVFVDIGSGKGLITAAAAQEGGYAKAVGIEKYRDKYDESIQLRSSMPEEIQQRLDFTLNDIADLDLRDLILTWSQPEVLLFCNNLAFGHGMNGRYVTLLFDTAPMWKLFKFLLSIMCPSGLEERCLTMRMQAGKEH